MTQKVHLTFLGTSDAIPTKERNHSAFLLSYADENILFDCGEGTQRQFRKADLNPCKVTKLLISHWHGDHVLGIPGLLQTLAFSGYNKDLEIFGPRGTKKFIEEMFKIFAFSGKLNYKVHEIEREGKFFENEDFILSSKKLNHGTPSLGYCFEIKDKLRIDAGKLKKSKIPSGKHIAELKNGKDIIFDGKKYKAKDFTYGEEGKKICFVYDTGFFSEIKDFVKDADCLVIESTFSEDREDLAKEYHHLTVKQSAEIAKKANVKKLFLTHISQRYSKTPEIILKQAKKVFKNSETPNDLTKVEL